MQDKDSPEVCEAKHGHHGRGPSSYWMHEPEEVFAQLALKPGDRVLDLGSGPGDYSLKAAELVGPGGMVFSLDKWEASLRELGQKAAEQGLGQLKPMLADITRELPIKDHSIDLCLISTVLHIFPPPKFELDMFKEIKRVLKPKGRLAVIECKKEDQPWGPPKHMRISPEEMVQGLEPHGYVKCAYKDLGKTYLIQFEIA
jgi:ubiquinone/menaquinone biosynthesis C-methylase UbiE